MLDSGPPIKVLYVISRFELGGTENYAFELSRFLDESIDRGISSVLGGDQIDIGKSLTKDG